MSPYGSVSQSGWLKRRGVVLIVCIWVLVTLSLLALGFAYRVRLAYKAAAYHAREQELRYLAKAVVLQGISVLAADTNEVDALNEAWRLPLSQNGDRWLGNLELQYCRRPIVSCIVIDEERKINVNVADAATLMALGIEEEVVSAILDWRDEDDQTTSPGGAESAYYRRPDRPYRCKNKPLESLAELLLVKGIGLELFAGEDANRTGTLDEGEDLNGDGQLQPGLRDLLTVYGDGLIDLNTVSAAVLAGIPGVAPETAQALVVYRSGGDGEAGTVDDVVFESLTDLQQIPWLAEFEYLRLREVGKVASEHFSVCASASEQGTLQRVQIEATVRRTSEGLKLVTWTVQ